MTGPVAAEVRAAVLAGPDGDVGDARAREAEVVPAQRADRLAIPPESWALSKERAQFS